MGFGDELMNSGLARGARLRGKRIAFGDGKRIIWHANAHVIFHGNPNVAPPTDAGAGDLEWIASFPGKRPYHIGRENLQPSDDGAWRWVYNPDFRATPGEVFLTEQEIDFGVVNGGREVIVIEPNVKGVAPNKQWPRERYQQVAQELARRFDVVQPMYGKSKRIGFARGVRTESFRDAMALLSRSRLFIGAEGGLHHAAAAFGKPAVVLFGGFTHPRNTGYDFHANIFVGEEPCGRQQACLHCKVAMDAITVERVVAEAERMLA